MTDLKTHADELYVSGEASQDIEESVKQLRQRTVEGSEVWKEKYGGGNLTTVFKS